MEEDIKGSCGNDLGKKKKLGYQTSIKRGWGNVGQFNKKSHSWSSRGNCSRRSFMMTRTSSTNLMRSRCAHKC